MAAPVLGLTLLEVISSVYAASGATNWDLWRLTLEFGSAVALWIFSVLSGSIERFVGSRQPLGFLGDASYSICLVHYPVVGQFAGIFGRHVQGGGAAASGAFLLFLVLAELAAGCALHIAVKRPARALFARAFAPRKV